MRGRLWLGAAALVGALGGALASCGDAKPMRKREPGWSVGIDPVFDDFYADTEGFTVAFEPGVVIVNQNGRIHARYCGTVRAVRDEKFTGSPRDDE